MSRKQRSPLAGIPVPKPLTKKERAASKAKAEAAARAFLEPPKEERTALRLLAANTDAIIRIEKTLAMLVKSMCGESRRNWALGSLPVRSEGSEP